MKEKSRDTIPPAPQRQPADDPWAAAPGVTLTSITGAFVRWVTRWFCKSKHR